MTKNAEIVKYHVPDLKLVLAKKTIPNKGNSALPARDEKQKPVPQSHETTYRAIPEFCQEKIRANKFEFF